MRLVVLYDLPIVTKAEKRAYSRFHRFLVRDGYDMLQLSVYARLCNGQDAINKHITKLKANLPASGSVRCMQVTEKQFTNIQVLVGTKAKKEDPKYSRQLSFF